MFGFITNRAHHAAGRVWADEIETLTTARDALSGLLDEKNRRIVSLEADLRAKNNRIANMQKDIDQLEAEAKANARFVEVGKARLESLARQNEKAKAKRRAKVKLPDGLLELPGGGLAYTCKGCDQTVPLEVDVAEFAPDVAYCGGSPRCLP